MSNNNLRNLKKDIYSVLTFVFSLTIQIINVLSEFLKGVCGKGWGGLNIELVHLFRGNILKIITFITVIFKIVTFQKVYGNSERGGKNED